MFDRKHVYSPPRLALLRWLTHPRVDVPEPIATMMLGELFTSRSVILAGLLNGVLINGAAIGMGHFGFAVMLVLDLGIAALRIRTLRQASELALRAAPTPTDLLLTLAIAWTMLQGATAFTAMLMGKPELQVLAATTSVAMIGPCCARNYPAPRLALLLVACIDLPMVAGAVLSAEPWLLVLLVQTPLYLWGSLAIIARFQTISIASLVAEHESGMRARHDPLTGLLNRFGLAQCLERIDASSGPPRLTLFYLDLDGFKQVNDLRGHSAGDRLLQAVAHRLRASVRADDMVARLGGDEFVILAHDMAPPEAAKLADAIIGRIGGEPYPLDHATPCRVGVSIGFACAPEDGVVIEDLRLKADAALYEAKALGKGVHHRFGARIGREGDFGASAEGGRKMTSTRQALLAT